jgi:hypothetical protein
MLTFVFSHFQELKVVFPATTSSNEEAGSSGDKEQYCVQLPGDFKVAVNGAKVCEK